jgi:hypothetical protein
MLGTGPDRIKRRHEMRCSKCRSRMDDEVKESILRGTTITYRCRRCENEIVVHKGNSLFSSIFPFKHNAIEVDHRTARGMDLH